MSVQIRRRGGEPTIHQAALASLVVNGRRGIRILALVGVALLILIAAGLVIAKMRTPAPIGPSSTGTAPSTAPALNAAAADTVPVRMVREFLQASLDRTTYQQYVDVALVYTPIDASAHGWAQRDKDGSHGATWESLTDPQREDVLRSVTYRDAILPNTLTFTQTKSGEPLPAEGSYSYYFTIQTKDGKTLNGWALGSGRANNTGGIRGSVHRLSYDVSTS